MIELLKEILEKEGSEDTDLVILKTKLKNDKNCTH